MNFFDTAILSHLNVYARQSWLFDTFVLFLSGSNFVKGGVMATAAWWAWFRDDDRRSQARHHVIVTLFSCVVTMVLARILVIVLPFRPRPLHEPSLDFVLPHGVDPGSLDGWSSLPSDHAVLFFTLATGLLFIARPLGVIALVYAAVVIALPRVYLGLHYPTDVLLGGAMGAAIAYAANRWVPHNAAIEAVERMSMARPAVFYPVLFVLTYQLAVMFNDLRSILGSTARALRSFV